MARRHEIFQVIKDYKSKTRGHGPSYRKLLDQVHKAGYKMCLATLRRHIDALVDENLLLDPEYNEGMLIIPTSVWLPESE